MIENVVRPSRAEELFNTLKALANSRPMIKMREVRTHLLSISFGSWRPYLNRLVNEGAVELVIDAAYKPNSIRPSWLKFLKDNVSIPQGKRGRKPGSKNTPKELLPPVQKEMAPQVLPAPVRESSLTSLPQAVSTPTIPTVFRRAAPRVMVFIDENQMIMSEQYRQEFNLDTILAKVKQGVVGEIERVFIYCSEATESRRSDMMKSLFRPDNPLVRFVKTGSQTGVIDKRIREDIELWSRVEFISTIVLGTADGGPDFLSAMAKVRESGKKLVLLKTAGHFNSTLRKSADTLINGSSKSQLRQSCEQIIVAAENGNFYSEDLNSRLVWVVAMGLKKFFGSGKEADLPEIMGHVQTIVRTKKEFTNYTEYDLREVVFALIHTGRLLNWKKLPGRDHNVYRLYSKCQLPEVLQQVAPASLRI